MSLDPDEETVPQNEDDDMLFYVRCNPRKTGDEVYHFVSNCALFLRFLIAFCDQDHHFFLLCLNFQKKIHTHICVTFLKQPQTNQSQRSII